MSTACVAHPMRPKICEQRGAPKNHAPFLDRSDLKHSVSALA